MSAILRVKYEGEWIEIPSLIGKKGTSITAITRVGRDGTEEEGYVDTYRIDFSDGTSTFYTIKNGAKGA